MNDLSILNQTVKTMSSREMAVLCQKPHDNVLKLVRSLIDGGIVKSTTPHYYTHPQNGQTYVEYLSDKRDSLVIVARLSPEFTANVIDRWQELENQIAKPALPDFTNPVTAARAWADEFEAKQALQITLQQAQPKINHYDKVADRKNLVNATKVGNKLGMSAMVLNRHLDELGVYNQTVKRGGRTFNLWFIQKGYGEMIQGEQGYDQPLFTHKGEAWVIEQLISEGVA